MRFSTCIRLFRRLLNLWLRCCVRRSWRGSFYFLPPGLRILSTPLRVSEATRPVPLMQCLSIASERLRHAACVISTLGSATRKTESILTHHYTNSNQSSAVAEWSMNSMSSGWDNREVNEHREVSARRCPED